MQKSVLIDWIAATLPKQFTNAYTVARYAEGLFPTPHDTYVLTKPLHGYRVAVVEPFGILIMTSGTEKMGTHVILTGSTLNKLADAGFPRIDALRNLISANASISRLDVAMDVKGSFLTPHSVYDAIETGKAKTRTRNARIVRGLDGGATAYIGSPTSEKMMRFYDKGIESGQKGENWMRMEFQLSGGLANRATRAVLENGLSQVVLSLANDMVKWDNPFWEGLVTGEIADIAPSSRKLTNTKKWLLDIVAGSLAEASLTDPDIQMEFWERVQEEIKVREKRKLT